MTKRRAIDDYARLAPKSRAAWRAWLREHNADTPGVWLALLRKGSTVPGVRYDEAVEEALCFGWIDSTARSLDATHTMILMTPRKPRSAWSGRNKERVARLIRAKRMAKAGLAKIEAAKQNGSWSALDAVEALTEPPDLKKALAAHGARARWQGFSPSSRKMILWWISSAKRPETRAARIEQAARMASLGLKATIDRDPAK